MNRARVVVLGATTGPRADALRKALAERGVSAAFVGYDTFCAAPEALADALQHNTLLRFDSPDRERTSVLALYQAGAVAAETAGYPVLSGAALDDVLDTRGPIGSPAQLALGLAVVLNRAEAIARDRGAVQLARAADIATSFDKRACSERLAAAGIAVSRAVPAVTGSQITGFEALMAAMHSGPSRVFVKLRFGSAAAGMTALARGPGGALVAYTTAQLADGVLMATRAVRRLTSAHEIAPLIDALAPLGLHCEAWQPKAQVDGCVSDLRLISVAGSPVFAILRLSRSPMTNLHLGGERRPVDALRRRVGEAAWRALLDTCRRTAALFPASHMLGIDAAMLVGDRRHAVFEVNAFGDFVKGVSYRGMSPQAWQIVSWQHWRPPP